MTVCYADPADTEVDATFRDQWDAWHPDVPLITLRTSTGRSRRRSSSTCATLEQADRYHRLVVLIPEVAPARPWQRILHNQRGFVLDRAIQRGTANVVICRLHFQLANWSPS